MIVDSYAWIEFLGGSSRDDEIRSVLSRADFVMTPDIVLAEVARKLLRDGIAVGTAREKLAQVAAIGRPYPITVSVAIGAYEADRDPRANAKSRKLGLPGLTDALVLATARALSGGVLTGDPHFKGLPETIWIGA